MEEISRNEGVATQRELSRSLNISLGLVNAFVKRIVRKGYFKITTIPRRRVRYLLTPKGLAEKSRLTAEFLHHSLSYYREKRRELGEIAHNLKKREIHKVALVGTGELAELFLLSLREAGVEISLIVSKSTEKEKFLGYAVQPLSSLRNRAFDAVCLGELEGIDETISFLKIIGLQRNRIIKISVV